MTEPIHIAHFADTHLGYSALTRVCPDSGRNQRAVDIEQAFAAVIDRIIAAGDYDLVIHAGDVFHHSRPPMQTLIFFVRQLRRLEAAGIPVVVIGGNHDTPRLRHAGSVLDLCQIACTNVQFITGYEWERPPMLEIKGQKVAITAVPHGAFTNEQSPDALPTDRADVNILVAHGSYNIDLATQLRGGADDIKDDLLTGYHYIALGHWHIEGRKADRTYYSGSTERIGLADFDATPGFNRVTLHGDDPPTVEHIEIPARAMLKLPRVQGSELSPDAIVAEVVRNLEMQQRKSPDTYGETLLIADVYDAPAGTEREIVRALRGTDIVKASWAFVPRIHTVRVLGSHMEEAGAVGMLLDEFDAFVGRRQTEGAYDPLFAASFAETGHRLLEDALKRAEQAPLEVIAPPAAIAATAAGGNG